MNQDSLKIKKSIIKNVLSPIEDRGKDFSSILLNQKDFSIICENCGSWVDKLNNKNNNQPVGILLGAKVYCSNLMPTGYFLSSDQETKPKFIKSKIKSLFK